MNKPDLSLKRYMKTRTLILGDVNSGKTGATAQLVETFCNAGRGAEILVLDLAPEPVRGIGGKLPAPASADVLVLACPIIAPRLTGIDADHIRLLAEQNAQAIEPLIGRALRADRSILVINDVTLYLHAGDPKRLLALLDAYATAIVNAYYGDHLPAGPLTEIERSRVETLKHQCGQIIHLP